MRIRSNRSILQGRVNTVQPQADGFGSVAELEVKQSRGAAGHEDFVRAAPGAVLEIFLPEPGGVEVGKSYEFTATVLGGPGGERIVAQSAKRMD